MKLSLNLAALSLLASSYYANAISGTIDLASCNLNSGDGSYSGTAVSVWLSNGWSWKSNVISGGQRVCSNDGVLCVSNVGNPSNSGSVNVWYADTEKSVNYSPKGLSKRICPGSGNQGSTAQGTFSF